VISRTTLVATNHTIGILHVPDSLATTALGDFLIHTVSLQVQVQVTLRLMVSQSVSLGIEHPPGAHDQIFIAVSLLITDSLINPQSDNGTRASFPCCVVTVFTDCLATLPELFTAP
jgi:hypothetical protein